MLNEVVKTRALGVKLFVMDADGTMTDSAMYYSHEGEVMKRFSARDGMGITLLTRASISTAVITSENSEIVRRRSEKLGISHTILHCRDKTSALKSLCASIGISLDAVGYIGDDINDIPVMKICGLTACPSDSVPAVLEVVHYVCDKPGGNGAIREFAELVLKVQGKETLLPENW